MKTSLILIALAASAVASPTILPRTTQQTLATRQAASPMPTLEQPVAKEASAPRPEPQSIIKQSTILHDGKNWTLVPTGAVIFMPAVQRERVDSKPVGTLLAFTEFLAKNRSWITTSEVSFDQAAGTEPLSEERVAFWSKQDKIVIAIHQNGPISVRLEGAKPIASTHR